MAVAAEAESDLTFLDDADAADVVAADVVDEEDCLRFPRGKDVG